MNTATTQGQAMEEKKKYNPALIFLAGLLTFCLGVIGAVFSALDKVGSGPNKLLGYVLAWAALTALTGTISAAVLQADKCIRGKQAPPNWLIVASIAVPILPGIVLVIACARLSAALLDPTGTSAGLLADLCAAWLGLFRF